MLLSIPGREEPFTEDPKDERSLMFQIWYPAVKPDGKNPASVIPAGGDPFLEKKFLRTYAKALHLPDFALDYWVYIRSNSFENAGLLPSDSPYPVIIISHGLGTTRMMHISQAENLASHGYVVVGIDHTYSTTATVFTDGRITDLRAALDGKRFIDSASRLGKVWTQDVSDILDQLAKMNAGSVASPFKSKLDMERIGIMGHSFGGANAFHASISDKRIKAGVNMDGTNFDQAGQQMTTYKPFLFFESADFKKSVDEYREGRIQDQDAFSILSNDISLINNSVNHGSKAIYLEGSAHFNFTDLQLYSPLVNLTDMTGNIGGQRGAEIVNAYVLDFFDTHLKGKQSEFLNGPNPDYPEVKFDLKLQSIK